MEEHDYSLGTLPDHSSAQRDLLTGEDTHMHTHSSTWSLLR